MRMRMRMRPSVLPTISLLMLLAWLLLAHLLSRPVAELHHMARAQATEIAATAAELARLEVAANDRVSLALRLEAFNRFSGIEAMVIIDRRGQTLAAVRRNSAGNLSASHETTIPLASLRQGDPPDTLRAGFEPRFVARAAIGEIAPIGWVYLEYDNRRAAELQVNWVVGWLVACSLAGVAIVALWRLTRVR